MEKGKKRTKYINDFLIDKKVRIDLIISSHATRALETARIIAKALKYQEDKIMISKNIYHGDADSMYNLFYDLPEDIETLMIIGHNPTLTQFANFFLEKKIDWLATSGVVCIEFDTDKWDNIQESVRKAKYVISPKQIKDKSTKKKN
jgi:phosphohistidine phosphatase